MNFRDQWVTDDEGNRFVFTVELQRRLSDAGLPVDPAYLDQLEDLPAAAPGRSDWADSADQPHRSDRPQRPERTSRRDRPRRAEAAGTTDRPSGRGRPDAAEPATIQIDPESGKYIGRIKWYNQTRGYGFIARGGGEDIFFHKSDVALELEDLKEGQWVLYDVEETQKGLEASDIELHEGSHAA